MGAEARAASGFGPQAFLRAVLRSTWVSLAGLAVAVVVDMLAEAMRPPQLLFAVGPLGCLVGGFVCLARSAGRGALVYLVSLGISVYAGLVALFLAMGAFLVH